MGLGLDRRNPTFRERLVGPQRPPEESFESRRPNARSDRAIRTDVLVPPTGRAVDTLQRARLPILRFDPHWHGNWHAAGLRVSPARESLDPRATARYTMIGKEGGHGGGKSADH